MPPAPSRPALARTAAIAALLLLAVALQGTSPTVSDPDAFYHLRHAWVYRTSGPFASPFPWGWFSIVRLEASDLWYGFHVLLSPLTFGRNLLGGLLAAGVLVTLAALVGVYFALLRMAVQWPLGWTLAFAFSSADVLYRLSMVRPQPLSLALGLLALSAAWDSNAGRRGLVAFLAAFAAAWLHLAMAWLVPVVVGVVLLAQALHRQAPAWRVGAAAVGGTLAGALLRPHPLGGLRLAWVQLVTLSELKREGVPLPFGGELRPLGGAEAARLFAVSGTALLLLLAFAASRRRRAPGPAVELRVRLWSSLLLALAFAAVSLTVASRAQELAAAFATCLAALAFSAVYRGGGRRARALLAAAFLLVLVMMPLWDVARYRVSVSRGRPPGAFARAAGWLAANAPAGAVVVHLWWDQFPTLFFWNPASRYIGGMDPVFQYVFDPGLFWKLHWLAVEEEPALTCGAPACRAEQLEPTAEVLRRDFCAAYVVVHRTINPRVDAFLAGSPEFARVFDDGTDVVYALVRPGRGPSCDAAGARPGSRGIIS